MKITGLVFLEFMVLGFMSSIVYGQTNSLKETPENWYQSGQDELQNAIASQTPNTSTAKNVILFIGDGMGVSTVTASRIYDGQSHGKTGEENLLSFEQFPHIGLSKTYNTNQQTPDSAGTMTAMMTGVKSKAGFIAIDQTAERGNCDSAKKAQLATLLEQAEAAGFATGIVSTARITHATPAATYAHTPERDWESDANMPESAIKAGCKDIAQQLVEFQIPRNKNNGNSNNIGNGIEVIMGGGRANFLPRQQDSNPNPLSPGVRKDGRNLIAEWKTKNINGIYVSNKKDFDNINIKTADKIFGLFNSSHMQYEADRANKQEEPSLAAMTKTAVTFLKEKSLQHNNKGFFLMIEAGRIDHGHHAGNAYRALTETQALSNAVTTAQSLVDSKDTLIIVTADHSHTLTIAGYPTRGNPILGKAVSNDDKGEPEHHHQLASDKLPYTTLGYRNGPGHSGTGRKDLTEINTEDNNFRQEALILMPSESHAGEDVAIYAIGPWAHLFHKTHEQHYIYHVMQHSLGLKKNN